MELNFEKFFAEVPDFRLDRQKKHKLIDILAVSVCVRSSAMPMILRTLRITVSKKSIFYALFWNYPTAFLRTIRLIGCSNFWTKTNFRTAFILGQKKFWRPLRPTTGTSVLTEKCFAARPNRAKKSPEFVSSVLGFRSIAWSWDNRKLRPNPTKKRPYRTCWKARI